MKKYLSSWNVMRVIRLLLGGVIVAQGVLTGQWVLATLGGLFSLFALLNIGCGIGGCNVPVVKTTKQTDEIVYEEVR